jgi:ribosomal protein S18 acetylase RimI-like enzyme
MSGLSITRLKIDELEKAQASVEQFWDTLPSQKTMTKFLSNSHNILISAELDGALVGQVIGYILDRWDIGLPMLFLYSIDVAENCRRRGIGTALIAAIREIGRAEGCTEGFVLTNESNFAAMQLYQSTGGKISTPDDVVMFEYD